MGTVSYTGMRQRSSNSSASRSCPAFRRNGAAHAKRGSTGIAALPLAALPAQSLNGPINTPLVNNVLTTQINSDLKTKFSYRYYDYDNRTPQLTFADWAIADATSAKAGTTPTVCTGEEHPISLYQAECRRRDNWRPANQVNVGGSYNYEHYDFTRVDARSPRKHRQGLRRLETFSWITARGQRSSIGTAFDNYNYLGNVGSSSGPQPGGAPPRTTPAPIDNFYLDNRNRAKAQFYGRPRRGPKCHDHPDHWLARRPLPHQSEPGSRSDERCSVVNVGVELAYVANPDTTFLVSYMNEHRNQMVTSAGTSNSAVSWQTPIISANVQGCREHLHRLSSTMRSSREGSSRLGRQAAPLPIGTRSPSPASLPERDTTGHPEQLHRQKQTESRQSWPVPGCDDARSGGWTATAKYASSDPRICVAQRSGGPGRVRARYVSFRYAWERNSVTNWNNDYDAGLICTP